MKARILVDAVKTGIIKALKLSLKICKIIIPVFLFVELLEYSGWLSVLSQYLSPFTGLFGLPGNASLALLFANTVNIYAAIAAIKSVSYTVREITILGLMIGLSHSLPLETSILKTLKIPRYAQILLRLSLAILIGMLVNLIWRV